MYIIPSSVVARDGLRLGSKKGWRGFYRSISWCCCLEESAMEKCCLMWTPNAFRQAQGGSEWLWIVSLFNDDYYDVT